MPRRGGPVPPVVFEVSALVLCALVVAVAWSADWWPLW